MADVNQVVDNTLDSINKARTARPVAGSSRIADHPVLFLVGNSTMRTGTLGNGDNGQWGWGYFFPEYFDSSKITVENHALGGMSSRTFYNKLWKDVLSGVRKGDWVIIELGHNDNGPYDSGRARASIPGTGKEKLSVTIKETGEKETVYSYGEYMRRFIKDVKKKGAKPILFSLTPRNAWEDADSTVITRVNNTYGKWAKEIADEENIPFVDLNEITARKYERFGKEKVKTMFYLDRIHTSAFGARVNAESAAEGIALSDDIELKTYLADTAVDSITGSSRIENRPVVFTIGDSTVKNEDNDENGMWGWGTVLHELFDLDRISVENHAMAGRSARTFLDEGRWDKVYKALRPGDFVIMQFGHNDGGDINTGKARGELHGAGPESKVFRMEKTGINQVVYTYGWYLRKFIMDTREKGAIPIVVSHTPRNKWADGKIESNASDFGLWAKMAALQAGAYFIDLNRISGEKLQAIGPENSGRFFKNDHTHSSKAGAKLNAAGIAYGLCASSCPLAEYLLPKAVELNTSDLSDFNLFNGAGFDYGTHPGEGTPFFISVSAPDGDYRVSVTLGDSDSPSSTCVRAESRRLMLPDTELPAGESSTHTFIVNKRSPFISLRDSVALNKREIGTMTWDDKLTLEFTGSAPAVSKIRIEPITPSDSITTIFLCGNSTVVDQCYEPWTSWGQIIPAYFNSTVSVANHAESGESLTSFIRSKRLDKVLSSAHSGDYMIIEFGHNDQKEKWPGAGAWYNFSANLKTFIDKAKEKGVRPILVTPAARRSFDSDGRIINTHGDYPDAIRTIAQRENIPLVDLNKMTMALYESLGEEGSKKAFVHYPANTFDGQSEPLADNTHFNPYGATQLAKLMAEGLKKAVPELAGKMYDAPSFSPANPDNPEEFIWHPSRFSENEKPYGN